jgi:hypothetical protein
MTTEKKLTKAEQEAALLKAATTKPVRAAKEMTADEKRAFWRGNTGKWRARKVARAGGDLAAVMHQLVASGWEEKVAKKMAAGMIEKFGGTAPKEGVRARAKKAPKAKPTAATKAHHPKTKVTKKAAEEIIAHLSKKPAPTVVEKAKEILAEAKATGATVKQAAKALAKAKAAPPAKADRQSKVGPKEAAQAKLAAKAAEARAAATVTASAVVADPVEEAKAGRKGFVIQDMVEGTTTFIPAAIEE